MTDPSPAPNPHGTGGCMLALYPSAGDAARLALPGGEPADELHCTLVYVGKDGEAVRRDAALLGDLVAAMRATAALETTGLLCPEAGSALLGPRWGEDEDGGVAAVTLLDNVDGLQLRLVRQLARRGREFPTKYPSFRAHLTLGYGTREAAASLLGSRPPGPPVLFDRLVLSCAGERLAVSLGD